MAEKLKPGQKFPTPSPGCGDRVFYENLLKQRPESPMAQEWCVNYGVLPDNQAAKLDEIVTNRKKKKAISSVSSSSSTKKKKKKKKTLKKKRGNLQDDAEFEAGISTNGV